MPPRLHMGERRRGGEEEGGGGGREGERIDRRMDGEEMIDT